MKRTLYTLPRRLYWDTKRPAYDTVGQRAIRRTNQTTDRKLYIKSLKDIEELMSRLQPVQKPQQKAIMCLLIAAHNEELVLESTLRSAIAAGMKPEHIYLSDDNSIDATYKIARSILPYENIFRARTRGGKGMAIAKAAKKFNLSSEYRWIHIADADGGFAPNYFAEFRKHLRVDNAAATGYIRSLPGKRVSEYRAFEYALGMEVHRRVQSPLGVIPVIPGPTSCFRADVFDQLNFANQALTEDFDVTLQLYRQKLGKVQFIPQAVAYTQDPLTVKAFIKQITRWYRGGWQVMSRHKIGRKLSAIDTYLSYQVVQGVLMFLNLFVWMPFMTLNGGGARFLSMIFLSDVALTFILALMASMRSRRGDVISAFPIIYLLKWMNVFIFMKTFIEVIVLRRFQITSGAWENDATRRYKLAPAN